MPSQRHRREHIELPSRVHRDVAEEGWPDRAETVRFDLGSVGCFCALLQAARERNGRSGDGLERPTYRWSGAGARALAAGRYGARPRRSRNISGPYSFLFTGLLEWAPLSLQSIKAA
jgi:hypothetical protein